MAFANSVVVPHSQADSGFSRHSPREHTLTETGVGLHTQPTNNIAPKHSTNNTTAPPRPSTWRLPSLTKPVRRQADMSHSTFRAQPRDVEILKAAFRYRYVSTWQFYELLYPAFSSDRTLRQHLAALTGRGLLAVMPTLHTGPNFPNIYRITPSGIRYIQRTLADQGIVWRPPKHSRPKPDRGITLRTMLHELLATQLDISIRREAEARDDLALCWHDRPRQPLSAETAPVRLIPDSISLVDIQNQPPFLLFAEIDFASHTPLPRIRKKLQAYHDWLNSADAQVYLSAMAKRSSSAQRPVPIVLWVVANRDPEHDERRLAHILTQTLDIPRITRNRFWLTSAHRFDSSRSDRTPVWTRARKSSKWLSQYHEMITGLPSGRRFDRFRDRRRYDFVHAQLQTMPLHPLFPQFT